MKDAGSNVTRLQGLLDELEASLLEASDEEILHEARDEGDDVEALASEVSGVIIKSIKKQNKRKLQKAREGYQQAVKFRQSGAEIIPHDAKERRVLLDRLITSPHNIPTEITVAFREGQNLSDEDVKSLLEDLAELGLLNDGDDNQ